MILYTIVDLSLQTQSKSSERCWSSWLFSWRDRLL